MTHTISVKVPDWADKKKFKEALNKALLELSPKKMHIDKLREILNIEELEEDISEEFYVRERQRIQ